MENCPICQEAFLKTNLEKHAASCGEPAEVNTVYNTRYFLIHVYVSVPHFWQSGIIILGCLSVRLSVYNTFISGQYLKKPLSICNVILHHNSPWPKEEPY